MRSTLDGGGCSTCKVARKVEYLYIPHDSAENCSLACQARGFKRGNGRPTACAPWGRGQKRSATSDASAHVKPRFAQLPLVLTLLRSVAWHQKALPNAGAERWPRSRRRGPFAALRSGRARLIRPSAAQPGRHGPPARTVSGSRGTATAQRMRCSGSPSSSADWAASHALSSSGMDDAAPLARGPDSLGRPVLSPRKAPLLPISSLIHSTKAAAE